MFCFCISLVLSSSKAFLNLSNANKDSLINCSSISLSITWTKIFCANSLKDWFKDLPRTIASAIPLETPLIPSTTPLDNVSSMVLNVSCASLSSLFSNPKKDVSAFLDVGGVIAPCSNWPLVISILTVLSNPKKSTNLLYKLIVSLIVSFKNWKAPVNESAINENTFPNALLMGLMLIIIL